MSQRYPRIRIPRALGGYYIREVVTVNFFMRRDHKEVAHGIMHALEVYRRAVGPQALARYVNMDGELAPLDECGWQCIAHELMHDESDSWRRVRLIDGNPGAAAYGFFYYGEWLNKPFFGRIKPRVTSAVSFQLPTEYLEAQGPEHVRALALDLAAQLPFDSGEATLALSTSWDGALTANKHMKALAFRYLALDIFDIPVTYDCMGTRVKGAHWVTFLGPQVLSALGGVEGLRARLHSPPTSVEPLAPERAVVTLGQWPTVGDIEAGDAQELEPYRELARVLEPFIYEMRLTHGHSLFPDDMLRWHRRFLDAPARL